MQKMLKITGHCREALFGIKYRLFAIKNCSESFQI